MLTFKTFCIAIFILVLIVYCVGLWAYWESNKMKKETENIYKN